MIPYAWMGGLALAVLWTHTLLVAAAALKRAAWIRRRFSLRPLSPGFEGIGVVQRAVIEAGRGPGGHLAHHRVERRGRRLAARRRDEAPLVGWHDRGHHNEVFGGRVRAGGILIDVEPTDRAEVWPDPAEQAAQAREVATGDPAETLTRASTAKGVLREVTVPLWPGQTVWIAGRLRSTGDRFTLEPPPDGPLLVSRLDPRAWARSARRRLAAFAGGTVLVAAGITAICLTPPAFGAVSTVGGVLGLGFFLLVQPAGVWMADNTAPPSERRLEG